jgi:hypothetical protein
MAYSYVEYTGDGVSTDFNVNFPYLARSHVTFLVAGVEVAFTWLSDTLVRATVAPANAAAIKVKRSTPTDERLVNFVNGSTLNSEDDLDVDSNQLFFIQQEMIDNGLIAVGGNIVSSQLADASVTTPKLAAGAVTAAKIAAGAVGPSALANTAVTPGIYTQATVQVDAQGRVVAASSGTGFTTEDGEDAVGGILTDSPTVDFAYDDAGNTIQAVVPDDAITNVKAANMAAATAKGRAYGAGTGDPTDLTGAQLNEILRNVVLTSHQRGVIAAGTGRGLQYVSALDKILFAESVSNGRIMTIDPITDYPVPLYTSAITPKGLVYAANSARLWMPNGTTDLLSVNPSGWTTGVSGVGARCDYLLYCSGNGTLFGFDNGASKIREFNSTTGVQIGSDYANANLIANTTDTPAVYVAANNSIYFTDLFGTVRRFNCTTHAITSLGVLHTAAAANGASVMLGSDGLLYFTNGGSTDKYKIKIVDPATDTVMATIDLSSNLTTVTGFYFVYEWRGYLYAGIGGSAPAGIVCVLDMSTRALVDAIVRDSINPTIYGAGMAASPTALRGYIGAAANLGFTSYLAFDR